MSNYPPPQREKLIWAALDFDGTIAESTWTASNPTALPGHPIHRNIHKLYKLIDAGYKIVIHTSRSWADYELVESWFNSWGIHFDKIVCGKLLADVYVDDRALYSEDWSWLPTDRQPRALNLAVPPRERLEASLVEVRSSLKAMYGEDASDDTATAG